MSKAGQGFINLTAEALKAFSGQPCDLQADELTTFLQMTLLVLKDEPHDAHLNRLAALCLIAQRQDYKAALPYILKAAYAPGFTEALSADVASCYYDTGAYAEALPHIEDTLREYPGDDYYGVMAAHSYSRTNQHDKARALVRRMSKDQNNVLLSEHPQELSYILQHSFTP